MGEIGFPRNDFLTQIRWWEVRSILRGYNNRSRGMWSSARWQTYHIMTAFAGSKALSEAGIHSPKDLLRLPGEEGDTPHLSEKTVQDMQAEIAAMNEQLRRRGS